MKKNENKEDISRRDIAKFSGLFAFGAGLLGRVLGQKNYEERELPARGSAKIVGGTGIVVLTKEVYDNAMADPFAAETDPIGLLKHSYTTRRGLIGIGLFASATSFSLGFRSNKYL